MKVLVSLFLALLLASQPTVAEITNTDSVNRFIDMMVVQHRFQESALRQLFSKVEIQQPILEAMSKPAEAKPWAQYREIFLTEARIAGGVQFWRDNQATLAAVQKQYGVPAEIIIAIIGVETKYGANTGKYRVIDALATLGFAYPKRSEFFLKELEQYLLLTRDEQLDPLQLNGSYAGAMGFPQFMPSSFRHYAADFDQDQHRDIWKNSADAIASVANYFVSNQWLRGQGIAYPISAKGQAFQKALTKGVKPDTTVGKLRGLKLAIPKALPNQQPAKLLAFASQEGQQLWLGLHNFYVITRYNHSPLYAMALYQLSQAIAARHHA